MDSSDQELLDLADNFVRTFELVFDHDWDFTQSALAAPEHLIAGTFLNPGVEDEGNNWANRGSLLSAYRELQAALVARGRGRGLKDFEAE